MNEASIQLRHEQNQDRLYALEEGHRNIATRLDHLDKCVDGLKSKVDGWSTRAKALFWVMIGVMLASGSGFLSVKFVVDLIKALPK